MKQHILEKAVQSLRERGFHAWSMEAVAESAGCAKGLVHYHYKTKSHLLAQVTSHLREERTRSRVTALASRGPAALDRLWRELLGETSSRDFSTWLSLLSLPDPEIRNATRPREGELVMLGKAGALALDLPREMSDFTELGRIVSLGMDGVQLALHCGDHAAAVQESYHRLWLGLAG